MNPHIGLYYPFIHFKDDDWLKGAALYWDKMGRIVPYNYETKRDSEVVKRLAGELDFIKNFNPREWCGPLCEKFAAVLTRHHAALQERYGIANKEQWPVDPITTANSPPEDADRRLAYIFGGKMDDWFVNQLVDVGLGVRGRGHDLLWVGMHPRLAYVYMTALAAQTASDADSLHVHPLTDETENHVALSGWTMERLAQGLLGEEAALPRTPITEDEVETRLASIAIETVIPKSLAAVDVGRIIQLRKKRRDELTEFQNWVHSFVAPLLDELAGIKNREALEAQLAAVVDRDVKPKMAGFRAQLEALAIQTARSSLNINVVAPKLLVGAAAALGFTFNPIVGAVAGLSVGLFDVVLQARDKAGELRVAPPAYLMHLEEGLQPKTVLGWVRKNVRKFAVGV